MTQWHSGTGPALSVTTFPVSRLPSPVSRLPTIDSRLSTPLRLDQPRTLQLGGIPIEREQFEPMTPVVAVNQSIHEPGRRFLL